MPGQSLTLPRAESHDSATHTTTSPARRPRAHVHLALVAVVLAWLSAPGSASAHVSVQPREVPANSSHTFTIRVPTERMEPTNSIRVEIPEGLTVSRFATTPGWARHVERDPQQRPTAVTWSGGQIAEGEYAEFSFIGRTPVEAGTLVFPAQQSYAGGETVEWIGPEDSERPAARVKVVTRTGDAAGIAATSARSEGGGGVGSDLPLLVAIISVVTAVLALILAAVALFRRSLPTSP